jgi:hypothetical protein
MLQFPSSRQALLLAGLLVPAAAARAGEALPFQATSVTQSWLLEDLLALGPTPQSGGVVITEFMKDPATVADTRGEWIELYNNLPWRVNIEGWTVSDDSGAQFLISNGGQGLRLAPGQYFVLGNSADTTLNGGVPVQLAYSGFVLGNGADQIVLTKPNGVVVDRVDYDDGVAWPDLAGRSVSLTGVLHDAFSNDDGASWCPSVTNWNGANPDTGTPGAPNDLCP